MSRLWLLTVTVFLAVDLQLLLGETTTEREFVAKVWTDENGLPQNTVRDLLPGRDGYLWIATQRGLARFDGTRFAIWNTANTPALASDNCFALAEGPDGAIWVGTANGLTRFGSQISHIDLTEVVTDPALKRMLPAELGVGCLAWSHDGTLLAGTTHGCYQLEGSVWTFRWREGDQSPVRYWVSALCPDAHGGAWVGCRLGMWRADPGQDRLLPVPTPAAVKRGDWVLAVGPDRAGRLWALIGSLNPNEASLFAWRNSAWRQVETQIIGNGGRSAFLFPDQEGGLWMPLGGVGLLRYREGHFTEYPLPVSRTDDFALSMIQDREGNFWVGTESSGLIRLRPRRIRTFTTAEGLPNDDVWAVLESATNRLWVATDGGVAYLQSARFVPVKCANGVVTHAATNFAEDTTGTLWVGTSGDGLMGFFNGILKCARNTKGAEGNNKVRAICPSPSGPLWLATARGLRVIDAGALSTLKRQMALALTPVALDSYLRAVPLGDTEWPDVWALHRDQDGTLWVGTHGFGLFSLAANASATAGREGAVPSPNVWAFHESSDGALWIGTDRGLYRRKDGVVTAFTTRDGLPDNLVNSIVEDNHGNLWVSHDRGIYRVPLRELEARAADRTSPLHCVAYDRDDGLVALETNGQKSHPAAFKLRDGRLGFASPAGLVMFDPAALPGPTVSPLVAIEKVRANGRVALEQGPPLEDPAVRGAAGLGRNTGLTFPAGTARLLEFEYTANNFVAPEKLHFWHRLEGLDRGWIDAGTRRRAVYANLPPGGYRFEVRAQTKYGVTNSVLAAMNLQLLPAFYQTGWFFAAVAAFVLAVTAGLYRWRLRYVRAIHRLQQESAIALERSRIARDLHDGLGANLTRLSLLVEQAERQAAEPQAFSERLAKLGASTRETLRSLRDTIWTAQPDQDTLDSLVTRICQQADELFTPANVACRFDLDDLPRDRVLPAAVRHHVFYAAKEALNNVARHAGATAVRIRAEAGNGRFMLRIEDNGRGLGTATDPRPEARSRAAGHGRGLPNMRTRIEALGGRFVIESPEKGGACVLFEIPL